jgi:hypothetical protein
MRTDRLQKKLPVEAIEKAFDVEIKDPIVAPAALAGLSHGIDGRLAGPVAIGIGVEHRFQDWLQVAAGNFLGNAISHRWNAQRPLSAICLGNFDPLDRRRKIAPRRQPVPEPVEVV